MTLHDYIFAFCTFLDFGKTNSYNSRGKVDGRTLFQLRQT